MKKMLFALLPLLLAGCLNVEYTGRKFAPQDSVKFTRNTADIPLDDYTMIGKFTVAPHFNPHPYEVEEAVLEKSREVGGDILLFVSAKAAPRSAYTPDSEEFGKPVPRKASKAEQKILHEQSPLPQRHAARLRQVYEFKLYKKTSEVNRQLGF